VSSFVPGKIILCGEHAVVAGEMALAVSIDQGVTVTVSEGEAIEYREDTKGLIPKAIGLAGGDESLRVEIQSELPVGSGLGSSAAVSAAVIRAVREYLGKPVDNDELFRLTHIVENIAHNGKSSGVDPAAVVYGGLIAYIKGKPIEQLEIPKAIKLLLVMTAEPSESTGEMVEIAALNPRKKEIFGEIGKLVRIIREKMLEGEVVFDLLNQNGLLLEQLGVVSESGRELSSQLREMGYAVKIAGAGGVKTGSGMMIVMGEDFAKAKSLLDNMGTKYFETEIGKK